MTTPLRIFISSPGDVGQERWLATRVLERLQGEFGDRVELQPIVWEHEPLRASAHFQEQIVAPSATDIVVCILWSRLGTRLPEKFHRADGTSYSSGTEWEFEDAVSSYKKRGTPDLLVYRKTSEPLASLADEDGLIRRLEQKKALDAFIDRWFGNAQDTFTAAFHTFESPGQFEDLLEIHLRKLILGRLPERLAGDPEEAVLVRWHKGSPYRGLQAFDEEYAPVFFGRTRATGEVRDALARQAANGRAFVLVFGMSGCGKSSLVRAGVLPTLTQPGVIEGIGLWRSCVFRPGDAARDLLDGLARALLGPSALPELEAAGMNASELAALLREAPQRAVAPLRMGLQSASQKVADQEKLLRPPAARLALGVDQLEELFTLELVGAREREGFVSALSALARSGLVWVLATMRSEFYPRCAELPELVALKEGDGQYDLLPPSFAEIQQIITQPARAAGLKFEVDNERGERLDNTLHQAAAKDSESLPLLEFTLDELFKRRTPDGVLTLEAYRELGGLEGALARRAEETFNSLEPQVQAALPEILRALVTMSHSGQSVVTARRVPLASLASSSERQTLVDTFVRARLLVSDLADDGQPVVGIAHEAILSHWPRVQQWLAEDLEFLRTRERVAEAAARWHEEGRAADLLLREGRPYAEGAELLARRRNDLDAGVVEFIQTSGAELRRAHRRRAFGTAGVFAVVLGFGIFSFAEWRSSARNFEHAVRAADTMVTEVAAGVKPIAGTQSARVANILDSAAAVYKELLRDSQAPSALEGQARMLDSFVDIYLEMNDSSRALNSARDAVGIFRRLSRHDPGNERYLNGLARSYVKLGQVVGTRGNSTAALSAFQRAVNISERLLAQHPGDPEARSNLARGMYFTGNVLDRQGDQRRSREAKLRALRIREELARRDPGNIEFQKDLAVSWDWYGPVLGKLGKPGEELLAYQRAARILEQVHKAEPADADAEGKLAGCYTDLGNAYSESEPSKSSEYFRQARAMLTRLTQLNPRNSNWQLEYDRVRLSSANTRQGRNRSLAADQEQLALYRTILARDQGFSKEDPWNSLWQAGIADTLCQLGLLHLGLAQRQIDTARNYAEARKQEEAALEVQQRLVKQDASNVVYLRGLYLIYFSASSVLAGMGKSMEAERVMLEGERVILAIKDRKFARNRDDTALQEELAKTRISVARQLYLLVNRRVIPREQLNEALHLLDNALPLYESLNKQDPNNPKYIEGFVNVYQNRFLCLSELGRKGEADAAYRKGKEYEQTLARLAPAAEHATTPTGGSTGNRTGEIAIAEPARKLAALKKEEEILTELKSHSSRITSSLLSYLSRPDAHERENVLTEFRRLLAFANKINEPDKDIRSTALQLLKDRVTGVQQLSTNSKLSPKQREAFSSLYEAVRKLPIPAG
jgi:hypothetical protein